VHENQAHAVRLGLTSNTPNFHAKEVKTKKQLNSHEKIH